MLNTERLLDLRKMKGLTQAETARHLGIERSTYVRYENSGIQPPNDMIVRLANFFEVTSDYLLGNSDVPSLEPSPDNEFWEMRQLMSEKPGARTLFSLAKTANNETLEFAGEMIRRMQKESGYTDD